MKGTSCSQWLIAALFVCAVHPVSAQEWPQPCPESSPATRWWWLGSAVDEANLSYNLHQLHQAGIGEVEITPIYGVQGNESKEIPYLSPSWMRMLSHVEATTASLGMTTGMATGTGWPFGGSWVAQSDAAAKVLFQTCWLDGKGAKEIDLTCQYEKQRPVAQLSRVLIFTEMKQGGGFSTWQCKDITDLAQNALDGKLRLKHIPKEGVQVVTVFTGRTMQKVKRAAPGGEGWVIDHFSQEAVENYLRHFDEAFEENGIPFPHTFFNDSYEVYEADWTPDFFDEFAKRRGYNLESYINIFIDESLNPELHRLLLSDYRETLGDLLYDHFTTVWTDWAHRHGAITRNQAHGSPANLIDLYAAVDIPECEGFGLSDFGILGLRADTAHTRKNDSDLSMLKYASSGAHISGKPFTSSETFTWLTEHFRTSLSQCKPDLDLMFVSGVNHVFFHGSCYSPEDEAWPGWRFYASVDMSPNNSWWDDMPAFSRYITRCQSFLQWGKPDNDVLVYLPYYDMIHDQPGRLLQFDIHSMAKKAPQFIRAIQSLIRCGYDCDYISDRHLLQTVWEGDAITMAGGTRYQCIIVPGVRFMPLATLRHLLTLAEEGACVLFAGDWPHDVPGVGAQRQDGTDFETLRKTLVQTSGFQRDFHRIPYGKGSLLTARSLSPEVLGLTPARREPMRSAPGLQTIRRSNPTGHHYFITNLQGRDVDEWVALGVDAEAAVVHDPMNGEWGYTEVRHNPSGRPEVHLQLRSGQSVIVRTYHERSSGAVPRRWPSWKADIPRAILLDGTWDMTFIKSAPTISQTFTTRGGPQPWTSLDDSLCRINMGTCLYATTLTLTGDEDADDWLLDLGDVRETARLRINGQDADTLFAVPYQARIGRWLHKGDNRLEVEVTNLPANRIAWLDRQGIVWRKFKEINVVDINYKRDSYASWEVMPSGLNSSVRLIPLKKEQ